MTNHGMKIALPGNSVNGAPYQLIFDSEMPTLLTVAEGTITLTPDNPRVVIPHNLGFAPWVIYYEELPGFRDTDTDSTRVAWDRYWHFSATGIASVDNTNFILDAGNSFSLDTPGAIYSVGMNYRYFITNYPIESNFLSTVKHSIEPSFNRDLSEGIKGSIKSQDLDNDSDLRKFSMHPAGKQLTIYGSAFGTGVQGTSYRYYENDPTITSSSDNVIAIEHNLGYAPLYLGAQTNPDGTWFLTLTAYSTPTVSFIASTNSLPEIKIALLVLAEPVAPRELAVRTVVYG